MGEVIQNSHGIRIEKDEDGDGVFYQVFSRSGLRYQTRDLREAENSAKSARPRKVTCSSCGEIDVEVFNGELQIGRLRVVGEHGWLMERLMKGRDYTDVAFCPACGRQDGEALA